MPSRLLSLLVATASFSVLAQGQCNRDNCLRAFIRSSAAASALCSTYSPRATSLPAFAAACSNTPTKVQSACSCLNAAASATATSTAPPGSTATSGCIATSNWPGWTGIKYAFIFGDSYTTISFNESGTQPSPGNPLGNPPYPGYTAANGPNWVDFLTVQYNASLLLTYDLAYGGATIDSALVAPYIPTVSSVAEQIENEWFPTYASKPASAPWASDDTLFAIFDGINDVGNSWYRGLPATTILNAEIFSVYYGLVDELYYAGARNFLFINVPPVDRAPLTLAQSAANQAEEKADILAWNLALEHMAHSLKTEKPDVNIFTVDAYKLFTEVLDNPASFPQTAGYKNTTAYCVAYANGTPTEDYFNATCGVPVNQYFWLNSLHPTYPMQNVLAQGAAVQLEAGPNVC